MSQIHDLHENQYEEASSRLAEGLKSCRLLMNDYRAVLTSQPEDSDASEDPAGDE